MMLPLLSRFKLEASKDKDTENVRGVAGLETRSGTHGQSQNLGLFLLLFLWEGKEKRNLTKKLLYFKLRRSLKVRRHNSLLIYCLSFPLF